VRSGKTYINNFIWAVQIVGGLPSPSRDFIITARTLGSLERNIVSPLQDLLGRNIRLDQYGRFDLGKHKMNCFGADSETSYKTMTGMTGFGWYGNEVTNQHPNTIIEAFNRCSGDGARILWDTNPDHPYHHVKTDFIDQSGLKNSAGKVVMKSFHFGLEDNTFLSEEYIENVKRTTPEGMWYDRRIKGLWVAAEGIIYEGFHRDKHTCKPFEIPKDWQRVRGIDFGTIHPFVMLWGAVDPDGRLYIYREYFKTNTLIKDHAAKIKALSGEEKYLWTVSDHDAQERIEYDQYDISTKRANKSVKLGLDLVAQRMVDQIDNRPRVVIFNTCKELIRQIGVYRWLPFEEGKPYREEPLKVDDDGPDVLRYIITELDFSSAPKISEGFRGYRPRR